MPPPLDEEKRASGSAAREERHVADQGGSPDQVGPLNALLGNPGSIARLTPVQRMVHILCDAPSL